MSCVHGFQFFDLTSHARFPHTRHTVVLQIYLKLLGLQEADHYQVLRRRQQQPQAFAFDPSFSSSASSSSHTNSSSSSAPEEGAPITLRCPMKLTQSLHDGWNHVVLPRLYRVVRLVYLLRREQRLRLELLRGGPGGLAMVRKFLPFWD